MLQLCSGPIHKVVEKKCCFFYIYRLKNEKNMSAIKKLYMLLYIISALFLNSTNCVFYYMEVEKTLLPYSEKKMNHQQK